MRGIKLVHLPVSFRYSEGGQQKEDSAITLQAPSLDQFAIHNTMVAYASEAMKKIEQDQAVTFAAMGPSLEILIKAKSQIEAEQPAEAPQPETDEQMAERVISTFAKGLGSDKFPGFMEYLKKVLTNNAKLARVGETQVPLADLTWKDIADHGGMDAVNLVFASFAGFFLKGEPSESQKETGNSSPRTSLSVVAAR